MVDPLKVDLLWRQYTMHVDLYKHYWDQAVKTNAFYYAITGAILSFYFTHIDVPTAKWALLLPLFLSLGLALIAIYGAYLLQNTRQEFERITRALDLLILPEVRVLSLLLIVSAVGALLVAVGLASLLCH